MDASPKRSRFRALLNWFAARRIAEWLMAGLVALTSAAPAAELKLPLLWQKDLQSFLESAATVADLNADGREKIIVAVREELFALEAKGKVLWHWRTKGRFMTYPAVLVRPGQPSLIYAADNTGLF